MKHEELKKKALDAIEDLTGDTSVSQEQTIDSLEELKESINIRISGIEEDIKVAGRES